MIRNIISVEPWTRVNDFFIKKCNINASIVDCTVTHSLITSPPNSKKTRFQADWYRHVACDVAVESVLDYPYPFITEKTYRPFACKRMLIAVAPANVLKLLHSKGFETFGDIIDESYDAIVDPEQRFFTVSDSIRKLCSIPIEEIQQYFQDNTDKFEHNFQVLKKLHLEELNRIQEQLDLHDTN